MEIAVPILPVADLSVAKEFYVGKLGFDLDLQASGDGKTGLLGQSAAYRRLAKRVR